MKIGIISIHYKNLGDTLGLLSSLSNCIIPKNTKVSIYIVDNEGSVELSKKLKQDYPQVYLLGTGDNLGFAAGNNLGLKKAMVEKDDIIVCINNDTFVEREFIKQVVTSPITDPKVGVVGGLIYFAPGFEFHKSYSKKDLGKVVWYAGGAFDWDNVLGSNAHVDEVDRGQFTQIQQTPYVTGALLITRSDVLEKVGLFDEKYFMYMEDDDLSERIKQAGFKVMFDPHIKMWHKVAQGSSVGSNLNDYFITRNRLYFGLKYAKVRTKFALVREALRLLFIGRKAQQQAVLDFFQGKMGKGSFIK